MAVRKRKQKVSKGINGGGGKVRTLTPVEKVNMGRGLGRTFADIGSVNHAVAPKPETAKRAIAQIAKAAA